MKLPIRVSPPLQPCTSVVIFNDFVLDHDFFVSRKQDSFIPPDLEIRVYNEDNSNTKVLIRIMDGWKSAQDLSFRVSEFSALVDPNTQKLINITLKRTWEQHDWEFAEETRSPITSTLECSAEELKTEKVRLNSIYKSVEEHFAKEPIPKPDKRAEYMNRILLLFKSICDSI